MKYRSIFYVILLFTLLCTSCDEATIQVTNKVHNVQLDNISFDKFGIGSHILPGESTQELRLRHYETSFPLSAPIQFYMVKGDRRVFLKTKEIYTLNADDKLVVVISDDTEVENILND
jgi:DNA-binding LytR/AlgR family response regulator